MSKQVPVGGSLDGWMQHIWAQARLRRGLVHAAGALSAVVPALAFANPTGGQVAAGSATIGTAGSNGVVVNQNSQRAAINWQQFSIGSNEYVQFNQPNSSSVVLNRVIGSNPSSIFGNIRANGQVFLINPNGILFAPGSTLDVSGLTASTLDISDANFMAGRYVFSKDPGAPDASVINQGNVTVNSGGYVVLAGDYVENDGVINAQSGKVLLAAGGAATLTLDNGGGLISYKIDAPTLARLAGVDNAGSIAANGGVVVMTADVANALTATAVNNSGLITARSVSQRGGVIELLSQGGGIENSGTLDASANQAGVAGGTVILKGDGRTRLTDASVIETAGDGAKGGYIDVSGHELNLRGRITAGRGGNLLLDPFFLHIVNGSSNTTGASTNNVGVGWINNQLTAGSNVTLQASNSIMNLGHAARSIVTTGTGNLTMQVNDGTIDIRGLTINIKGSLGIHAAVGSGGSILMNGATAKAISLHGSTITVAGTLTATSGSIDVTGRTSRGNHNPAFSISGAMHATGKVLVSYSNEGGVPTGYLNMKDVTGGTIKIVGEKIVTGNLTATGTGINAILLEASGSFGGTTHVNPASILVNGNVKASNSGGVFMRVKHGTGINVTGSLTAKFSHASLSASNTHSAAHIVVGGAVKGPEINITAIGTSSASVQVGDVTATKFDVNITAKDTTIGGAQVAKISTGNLTAAKNVKLTASGGNSGGAQITTGTITAYTSTCGSVDCNSGDVHITANHGVVSAGNILVTHSVTNPGGVHIVGKTVTVGTVGAGKSVSISAGTGTLTAGAITAGSDVVLKGNDIQLTSVTAGNDVSITGDSSRGFANIHATGLIKGKQVTVNANGNSTGYGTFGASIDLAGGVTATAGNISIVAKTTSTVGMHITTGALQATGGSVSVGQKGGSGSITINGNVTAKAIDIAASDVRRGGNVTVNGGLTATAGHIKVTTLDSASSGGTGGNIKLGNVTAAGSVSIGGSFQGSAEAGSVRVQTGNVSGEYVQITAKGNAPTITTGTVTATGTVSSAGQHDYVHVQLNPTTHASSGSINITGLTKSSHGSVSIDANLGAVSTAAITAGAAKDIDVSGSTIHVAGAITAIGGSVCLTGKQASSHATTITVTGTIKSGMVQVNANPGSTALHGASIDLAKVASSLGGGIMINATTTAPVKTQITVGSLSAGGTGHIDVTQKGTSGGITINGNVTSTKLVQIETQDHGVGGNVTVTGNITGSNVVVSGSASTGADIHVTGNITAKSASVFIAANSSFGGKGAGGNITVGGAIKASNNSVLINAFGGGASGGNIKVGNVTAKNGIVIGAKYNTTSPGTAGHITVQTGNLIGEYVSISATGPAPIIKTGAITANGLTSSHGGSKHDFIKLDLHPNGSSGSIAVTGGVKSSHGSVSLSASKGVINAGNVVAGGVGSVVVNGNKVHLGSVSAGGQISVAASASASLAKLNASVVKVVVTQGDLKVGQLVQTGALISASHGSITDSTTGSLNLMGDTFKAANGVHLKAGTNITLIGDSFGTGPLSASAGGKLVETSSGILNVAGQILKAKQLVLSAATLELGTAKLTASSIQLSATSINNASGNGSIVAAKGTIHATNGVFLANENIVVSGSGPLISAASVDLHNAVVNGTGVLSVKTTGNLDASSLHVKAGGFTANGGSVDLTDAQITVTKAVTVKSGKNVNIGSAQISGSAVGISAGGNISNGSAVRGRGVLTAGVGKLNLKAKGDIQLSGEALIFGAGGGSISAAGSLGFAHATFGGLGAATLHAGANISMTGADIGRLGSVTMDAVGGSIDLTGVIADVTGQMTLQAKNDIVLSGVHITTGIFAASASGTIHNGGAQGAITAAAMKFDAKKNINMSSTVLTIGSGALTGVTGDTQMLQLLAALGLKPGSAAPNGAFLAGGSVTLGDLDITGNYLVLQGSSVSILGTVTAPTSGLLVEVRPGDPAEAVDVEDQAASAAAFNLSNKSFLALFPGDTIVIGDDAETGNVTLGSGGPFTLAGGTNLIFDTTGTITGLGNVIGTGLVGLLETLAGSASNNDVVTAGEIDPSTTTTSLGDQTDKKHLGHSGQGFGNGEGGNGIISADTDTSSVCH